MLIQLGLIIRNFSPYNALAHFTIKNLSKPHSYVGWKSTTDWQDETFEAAGLMLSQKFISGAGWIEV